MFASNKVPVSYDGSFYGVNRWSVVVS